MGGWGGRGAARHGWWEKNGWPTMAAEASVADGLARERSWGGGSGGGGAAGDELGCGVGCGAGNDPRGADDAGDDGAAGGVPAR
uniref:Uncharacterized protein n=1 Tax=Setaria italica TaxID=4555 RepID=A0A0Q3VDC5_SETIT